MTCPICNFSAEKFIPYGEKSLLFSKYKIIGGGYRENAVCPSCYSMDRERLIFLYLNTINKLKDLKILHVAPEKNIRIFLSSISKNYITADLLKNDVDLNIDLTNTYLEEESFDLIICNHVLEHIIHDNKAMKELYRILKNKGIAILQVPISNNLNATFEDVNITSNEDRLTCFGQEDHVRIYGKDYTTRLKNVGFDVNKINWWEKNEFLFFKKNNYALLENESLFICKKEINE